MTPALTAVDLGRLALDFHDIVVTREYDDEHERADERAPALAGEDVREHRAAPADVRALGCNGRGHGVVAADADAEDDTPDRKPEDTASGR